jgi:predicted Zn-dependent protease
MRQRNLLSIKRYSRRWIYGLLSILMAFSVILITPKISYGQSWLPLLFRGLQVIQLSTLSDQQEVRFGEQINQQLQTKQIRVSRNPNLNAYINQIGQRLVSASHRSDIPYTFQVVNDKSVNAFATMGGFVYINMGLIQVAENEAELASVMAHEIGHIAERHALTQMRDVALSQGLMSAAGLNQNAIVQLGVQLAVNLPNSREAELEADREGLLTLERAGYAPIAMVSFMKKLSRLGGSAPTLLSTHPATDERVVLLLDALDPQLASLGDGLDRQAYQAKVRSLLKYRY